LDQNNYAKRLNVDDIIEKIKSFNILATSLNILYNYFDIQTKLFLDLYLATYSDTSAKRSFM